MNKKAIGVGCFLFALASLSMADQTPSKQRLDAIWQVADNRVSQQVDIWFDNGDFPKVIQLLQVQAAYAPADYDVVTNLGWMQENVEEWDSALATYIKYRENNPQDKDAALPEADFYFRRKAYAKIPALLEPTLARHPHPNVYRILAHSYEKQNLYEDALRVWKAYVAIAPGDLTAKANLAKVEKKLGKAKTE